MIPKPFEIFLILVVLISAQMDLFEDKPNQMRLESRDPDYAKTGLTRSECYIDRDEVHFVTQSNLQKRFGVLNGELRKRFEKWF